MQSSSEKALWESLVPELEALGYKIIECRAITLSSILLKASQQIVQRDVAIKILRNPVDANDVAYKRFQQETKLLGLFSQDNIVKLFSAGRLQDGRLYMVMEFVDGLSLAQILEKDGALQESRLLPYLAQICNALEYAHNQKIVHRDLKPANIMVHKIGNEEVVKLVDLGIHKSIAGGDQKLTATGAVMPGTKDYMSPEQCRGELLDQRADIYSLGCVIYELLVGYPPMTAETDYAILFNHLNKEITEVPSRFPISSALKNIVVRCLKKKQDNRWSNVAEIGGQLKICKPKSSASYLLPISGFFIGIALIAAFVYCVFIGANQWSGIHKKALSVAVGKKNYSTTDEVLPRTPEARLATLESFEVARAAGGNTFQVLNIISEIIGNMPVEIAPEDKKAKDVLLGLLNKLRARFDSRRLSNSQLSNEDKAKIHYTEAELELRLGMMSDFGKSLDRLRALGVSGGVLLARCLNQVCFKYLSPQNVDQEMRYIDTYYSNSIANEDLVAHLISLAGNLQYSHHEKCVQYLNSATDYFCTRKVVASYNLYLELTSLLEKLKRPENTVRLSQCIAIPEPAKDQVHARISCDYARALLETDNLQNGERLYRQLSANKSFMAFSGIAEEFEYLRLLYAIKSKNKELRGASLARIVKQLQDKKSKFTEPAGQFFSLFLADPELLDSLQTNLKPSRTARPELLANEVTVYAHHLRIHGQPVKAISAYKFAHQLYECSPAYIAGNVSAYVGESNCLQTLGRLEESANCYVEAQAYLNSRGHMAADEQPELTSQHAVLLRELGRFDEAIAMHRRVLKNLLATRHDHPAFFAATAYELLMDYKKAKMKAEAKRTAAFYLPLLEADRAEAPGELKGFKDACSDL